MKRLFTSILLLSGVLARAAHPKFNLTPSKTF